jgi:hypothetical protein
MKNNKKWFTAIAVLLLFSTISWVLIISYNLIKDDLDKINNYTDKTRAINNSELWIEDAKSFFYNNRALFYDINKKSPCDTIWSISNYANYNLNSFILNETLQFKDNWEDKIGEENLKDDQWFINRTCSIYTKWIPNYNNASFSIKWESNWLGSSYKWQTDENGYYNINKILDNQGFGYFFTSDQIWEDEINIILDYNFTQFEWIDSLNIYNEDLYDKILLLKKNDQSLEINKTNIKNILNESMYIYSDANLEIWIVEFDWEFDFTDWFNIDKSSGQVLEWNHKVWNNSLWIKKWRLLCDNISKTCEIDNIKLNNNKVYLLYLKSFDKPTTYHMDITNKAWESIYIPSNFLNISNFWVSNWELYNNKEIVDISKKWWYFSDFSNVIYNYVYFSKN